MAGVNREDGDLSPSAAVSKLGRIRSSHFASVHSVVLMSSNRQ